MAPKSPREIIEDHFAAWNARDREGMVRDLAEDVVLEEDPGFQISSGVYRGHDGAYALWNQLFEVSDDASIEVHSIEEQPDGRALVLMTIGGTMRQSGIAGSREMAHIWEFSDGKAVKVRVFGAHDDARAAL